MDAVAKRPILTLKKAQGQVASGTLNQKASAAGEEWVSSTWWPRRSPPNQLWVVPHPVGGDSFFDFPRLRSPWHTFEAGPVFLLHGKHWQRNRGFGVVHILAGHWRELGLNSMDPSPQAADAVARFVAGVCARHAKVYCEFEGMRGDHRPVIIKGFKGTVILECRECPVSGEAYYSVVTAMKTTKAKGPEIGAL